MLFMLIPLCNAQVAATKQKATAATLFTEKDIAEAHADFTDPEHPALCISFRESKWKLLSETTAGNIGKSIVMVIDGKVYATPRIAAEIPHGKISITGSGFSRSEVTKLSADISKGELPVQFTLVDNK